MTITENNPIIFLDFDGVIINYDYKFTKVSEKCLKNLHQLVKETNAKIVISSTWRLCKSRKELSQMIKLPILDITPELKDCIRGNEIDKWLAKNPVKRYIIIDDDDDMGIHKDRLIQTQSMIGLTEQDVLRALELLKG